jgi:hypothetical protein
VTALLEHAGETRGAEDLLDEHGWSSYDQKIRLFRAAVEVLGDPGAVRKIGQFMLRSRIALPLLVLLRALGSPEQVLRNVANWQHPTRGLLPPSEFIPTAETTGLIVELGQSILDEACREATRWPGRPS